MALLVTVTSLALAITFVVGLIAPSWYIVKLFGQKNYFQPNRKGVLKLIGVIFAVLICLCLLFTVTHVSSEEEKAAREVHRVAEQQKKDESKKIAEQQAEEKKKQEEELRQENIRVAEEKRKQQLEEELRKTQEKIRQIEDQINFANPLNYREIARNPAIYTGGSFFFRGKVIQAQNGKLLIREERPEGDWATNIIWVDYESSLSGRILEDDQLMVWGKYNGIHTYQTTGGGEKSVPSFTALKINLLN